MRQTDHFVFLPAPLEVHAAVEPPLEDGPASAACLHVTEHLEKEEESQCATCPVSSAAHHINKELVPSHFRLSISVLN